MHAVHAGAEDGLTECLISIGDDQFHLSTTLFGAGRLRTDEIDDDIHIADSPSTGLTGGDEGPHIRRQAGPDELLDVLAGGQGKEFAGRVVLVAH